MRVCVRERERELMRECMREREGECVWMRVCVRERERELMRERMREREGEKEGESALEKEGLRAGHRRQ